MKALAGDIGGTKTLLRIVNCSTGSWQIVREERYASAEFATFDALVEKFLGTDQTIDAACFAVAGPVVDGAATITNLPWVMRETDLAQRFSIDHVSLVNDFYAVACGVPRLEPQDLVVLNEGKRDPASPIAILGAGTGLGEAFLMPGSDGDWRVVPSEGGHCDFAPANDEQIDLLRYLAARHDHVSYERVVSGMGIRSTYEWLLARDGKTLDASIADVPLHVAQLADEGDARALATLQLFVDAYGAEAGNLALKVLARGGVYLAGGIAAKNVKRFSNGRFMQSFRRKGRFAALMDTIPVHLVTNARVGLLGATEIARRSAGCD